MWRVAIVLYVLHCCVNGQSEWESVDNNAAYYNYGDTFNDVSEETEEGDYGPPLGENDDGLYGEYNIFGNGFGDYDEDYASGEGSGLTTEAAHGTFALTIKMKFKPTLEDETSKKFVKVSNDITRDLARYITEEMASIQDDFDVLVTSFEPAESGPVSRQTLAIVVVRFRDYTQKTTEELVGVMERFSENGKVGGKKVTLVEEISGDVDSTPGTPEPPTPVDYNALITYKKRFTSKLANPDSPSFLKEKSAVEEEINLYLIIQGKVDPLDLIAVNVDEFRSMERGRRTGVSLTITTTNVSPEDLNDALSSLVGQSLHAKSITAAELLSPSSTSTAEVITTTTIPSTIVTERTPPTNRGDNEPDPPETEEPTPPDTEEPNPPDTEEPNPPDTEEPNPPDTEEPNPPDEPEAPDHCELLSSPERGSISCSDENQLGSICRFTCDEGTYIGGSENVTCADDGIWDSDSPFCIRIFCPPHIDNQDFPNGRVSCTNHNAYNSTCSFQCNRGYELKGSSSSQCGNSKAWSSPPPTCELIPVDCVVSYLAWSACENGLRIQEGVVEQEAVGTGTPCPSPVPYKEEACTDCVVDWEEWGECSNNERTRTEYIKVAQVGAGEPCPILGSETEPCIDCRVEWLDWSACEDGERSRVQLVAVKQVGAGAECSELQNETEACIHCELEWAQWGDCSGGSRSRFQQVSIAPVGAGDQCPPIQSEIEDCVDCQLVWGEWEECADGERSRSQVVAIAQVGAGEACSELQTETEDCVDCQLEWGEWEECRRGKRYQLQYVSQPAVGAGKPCPPIRRQSQQCVHCKVDWGDWSDCSDGMRARSQVISREAVGAGDACPTTLQEEVEACVDCEISWSEWSECTDFERTRQQFVSVQPVGPGAKQCPHMDTESQDCFDCEVAWENWSECRNGKRSRGQYVLAEAFGGGKPCEYDEPEVEDCVDCQVEWAEWGSCQDGERNRSKVVVVEAVGAGAACPLLDIEVADCSDCVVEWEPWSECSEGLRERTQVVANPATGGGKACPSLQSESEICIDCEVAWADWGECLNGLRIRYQYENVAKVGAGKDCPNLDAEDEVCIECELEWGEWSECVKGVRTRTQFISVLPQGAGDACGELQTETESCQDCELEWGEFGQCVQGEMSRRQFVSVQPIGLGAECPLLRTQTEPCSDCVLDWGDWSECVRNRRSRTQVIAMENIGTGAPCPRLRSETERCGTTQATPADDPLCRYTRDFLGYDRDVDKRDILLLGDESGSIGWINFKKIKDHFKAVTRNIRGGIGSQNNQIAMMSFASWTRRQFGFDTFDNTDDIIREIDRAIYHGGHRSKIGQALIEADTWMFQQAEGMRSFPGYDDDNTHEILIATDGCRTSKGYFLHQGLKAIKKRGIKLSVLGIESPDPRCRGALKEMVDDQNELYEVGNWEDLDRFNERMNDHECR